MRRGKGNGVNDGPPGDVLSLHDYQQVQREGGDTLLAGYDVIRFVPPLVISKDEIDIAIKALEESIEESI